MTVALVFSILMFVLGWYTIFHVGLEGPAIGIGLFGTAAVACAIWGFRRDSLYFVAGGALGAGLLFPTALGIVPMIIGFIIFALLISLRLFTTSFTD